MHGAHDDDANSTSHTSPRFTDTCVLAPMAPSSERIAIICDPRSHRIGDMYRQRIAETSHAVRPISLHSFDEQNPTRLTGALEQASVALASVGVPGLANYAGQMHRFLNTLVRAQHMPSVGFFTHDEEHTHHIITQWLELQPAAQAIPLGILHIINANSLLSAQMLQTALDILTHNAQALSEEGRLPLSRVSVETLRRLDQPDNRKR